MGGTGQAYRAAMSDEAVKAKAGTDCCGLPAFFVTLSAAAACAIGCLEETLG